MMVPIYSIISCLAYFFWVSGSLPQPNSSLLFVRPQNHAVPLTLIRDAYEGVILAAFFYLLLQYLAPTPAEQKEYFRTYKLKKWAWPFGGVKTKPVSCDDNPHF
jgi:Organic solute transporter Ostalpha